MRYALCALRREYESKTLWRYPKELFLSFTEQPGPSASPQQPGLPLPLRLA